MAKTNTSGMTLIELQKVLGDRIAVALDNNRTLEERENDITQSNVILNIAKQMINNGNLILNIEKTAAKNGQLIDDMMSYKLING